MWKQIIKAEDERKVVQILHSIKYKKFINHMQLF